MAPVKGVSKEHNPWGWALSVKPEDVTVEHLKLAYRVDKFSFCQESSRRNCKRNPYCIFGLGEKKWFQNVDDNEANGDDSDFRGEGQYAGLQNLGATCYVNSLLQLWFHNPILRPAIFKWVPNVSNGDLKTYRPECAISQLQAMFARMKLSKRSKIDPTEFVLSLQLDTTEQQDAQEFSKLFMEVVVSMLNEYEDKHIGNIIRSSFSGQLQNETECLGCHNTTHREESFSELELSVKKTLEDSIKEMVQEELLNGTEQYFCSNCNKKQDAKRRTILLSLPPVLNLQLMRFVFDRETYRKKKVTTFMQFPEIIDMSEYITSKTAKEKSIYHLNAVLIHNGLSASSGHYVAQIKDIRTGIWHKFNDENVDQVSKKDSKNLVLADDESSVTKGRGRPKLAEGMHTSNGAYMLVYTLDSHVKNPEPDPELPTYLYDMLKSEDLKYEEEVMVSKAERDLEASVKEKRRKQVELLYKGSVQKQNSVTQKKDVEVIECYSDDDVIKPKKLKKEADNSDHTNVEFPVEVDKRSKSRRHLKKAASSDDEDFLPIRSKKPKNSFLDDSDNKAENESKSESKSETKPSESGDPLEKIDFVSTEWLQNWLDPETTVHQCDNTILACIHGNLAPPKPQGITVAYRIVPSHFGDEVFKEYGVTKRFKGLQSLCEICVQIECRRLRDLSELDEDIKNFQEILKKSDALCNQKLKSDGGYNKEFLKEKVWLGKESLRNWKRLARSSIEGILAEQQENGDVNSNSDSPIGIFNSEIVCEHDNLLPDQNARKLINVEGWSILQKHFNDAKVASASDLEDCKTCMVQQQQSNIAAKELKENASLQKSNLSDLYSNRNRPDIEQKGEFFVVPVQFVESWRKFVRDPTRNAEKITVVNKDLLCEHSKFKYSLTLLDGTTSENNNVDTYEDYITLLTVQEWEFLKSLFGYDMEIKVTIDEPNKKYGYSYTPDQCVECASEWWMSVVKKIYVYESAFIYIFRRDKNEGEIHDVDEDEDEEDFQLPAKRERREVQSKYDPSLQTALSLSANAIRRSQRPRRQRGEKTYKVSSEITIKELKHMIFGDFKAFISDQHLFHREQELKDSLTLQEAEIPAGATIYLEIDTVCKNGGEAMDVTPETGFQGTLLLGKRDANLAVSLDQPLSPSFLTATTENL